MNLRPLYDKVIVRRIKEEEKTASGLYVPEQNREKPAEGEVLAVGEGRIMSTGGIWFGLSVRVGDRVVFGKYAGTEITDTETAEKLLVLREEEILVVRTLPPTVN